MKASGIALGLALALTGPTMAGCKKKSSSSPAPAAAGTTPATTTPASTTPAKGSSTPPAALAASVAKNSPVVVKAGALALGLAASKSPAPAKVFFYALKDTKRAKPIASGPVDAKGNASVSLPPGSYVRQLVDAKGKKVAKGSGIVRVPKAKKAGLRLDDGSDTLVTTASPAGDLAITLLEKMQAASPSLWLDGEGPEINPVMLEAMAGPMAAKASSSGAAVDDATLKALAAQATTATAAVAAAITAKGGDPGASFDSVASAAAAPASQALCASGDCAAALSAQANASLVTALGGGAAALSTISKNSDPAGIVAATPGDAAALLNGSLLEQALIGFLEPLGNTADAAGKVPFTPAEKAMFVSVAVHGGVTKIPTFLSQLGSVQAAINSSTTASLPAVPTDEFLTAATDAAQGKFDNASAAISKALSKLTADEKKKANGANAGYTTTFTEYVTNLKNAAAFAADANASGAAASAAAVAAASGTATTFAPGGDCTLIDPTQISALVDPATNWPAFCFVGVATACSSLQPFLVEPATAPAATDTSKLCDYSVWNAVDSCTRFAAFSVDLQNAVAANALTASANAAISPFCSGFTGTDCTTMGLVANAGGDATKCDMAAFTPYTAQFTALGQACTAFNNDYNNMPDPTALIALANGAGTIATTASPNVTVCTAFTAPAEGSPASCEDAGANLGVNLVTDASGNCSFQLPSDPTAAFNVGDACSNLYGVDPTTFSSYTSQLSLGTTSNTLCTGFTAQASPSTLTDCPAFADATDVTQLQVVTSGGNCVLNTYGYSTTAGSIGTCTAFNALATSSTALQALFIASANPGATICTGLTASGVADCPTLAPGLVAATNGTDCAVPAADFTIGNACGSGSVVSALANNTSLYVGQLAPPNDLTLCTGAAAAGITDCSTLDPSLQSGIDASGNCSQANTSTFTIGGACTGLPTSGLSGYISALNPGSNVLCSGAAAANITDCSTLDASLTLSNDSCQITFPTFTLGDTCTNLSALSNVVQEYVVDTQAPAAAGDSTTFVVCTDVVNSSYTDCSSVAVSGDVTFTNSVSNATNLTDATLTDCVYTPATTSSLRLRHMHLPRH